MNENIELKNKEIITAAMRKDEKKKSQSLFQMLFLIKLIHLT